MSHLNFKYSLLKYIHSDLLGEALNIGILFTFPETGEVVFRYPSNFVRVRGAYGDGFSQSVVNGVLKGLAKSVDAFSRDQQRPINFYLEENDHSAMLNELLLRDATVLRFERVESAVLYAPAKKVVDDYYELFFRHYEENEPVRNKLDEEFISKRIKHLLASKAPDYTKLLRKDVVVSAPMLPEGSFTFDFAWKNEIDHFVKPVGFDLHDAKAINQKAATYFGYLTAISDAINGNAVDILTTRPQIKGLWQTYEKAVELIDAVKINKKIIEHDNFVDYADEIVNHGHMDV
ncbi:Protein of unknown function [Dyadobacter soli]|uniref:DUF3037 domain-containing protein n=1 Tax=Dyadobacter soli TaxID=659014 RepID=A0A1G7D2M1_9BACT|nr:DUF3037 domain-containing protein [Dyadobacter soli]SDE45743.1 Protein of unknown function [Dyadobacter soli]